jgi:hypothetical protein
MTQIKLLIQTNLKEGLIKKTFSFLKFIIKTKAVFVMRG